MKGQRLLVERVRLRDDGSAQREALGWYEQAPERTPMPYCGRRPEGFAPDASTEDDASLLRTMAELEAAAVFAFARLERELEHHDAPRALRRAAARAREDEVRHARVMAALATSAGAPPRAIPDAALPSRDLEAVALENAAEGCVFETYGALVATFQAGRAAEPALRRVFEKIASDERRHAALAARVDAWARTRLPPSACRALDRARDAALASLRADLVAEKPGRASLGLPSSDEARALVAAYFDGGSADADGGVAARGPS